MAKDIEKSLGDEQTRLSGARPVEPETARSLGDDQTLGGILAGDVDGGDDALTLTDLTTRYTITSTLGQGGMGEVLLAVDNRLKRQVAIKRIRGEQARSRTAIQRFLTEAQAIAALNHPNVVQVYDYGRDREGPFLVMEYVDGQSLLERCKGASLAVEDAIELTCAVLSGLGRAHELGIIHRDIKPANILLTRDGRPKLTDFGLAKQLLADHGQTVTGAVLGTIDFMPPEQRRNASEVDARSDLWALAATLYQVLTGKSPKVIRFDLIPVQVREALSRALEEEPSARFQTAGEFRAALQGSSGLAVPMPSTELVVGQCPQCGSKTGTRGRFCAECSSALKVPCLRCNEEISVWDKGCTQCGGRQAELLELRRSELQQLQAEVERLREQGNFLEALRRVDSIQEIRHPRLQDYRLWLERIHPDLRDQSQHLLEFGKKALEDAESHRAAWDYRSAMRALTNVPEAARLPAHDELKAQLQRDFTEAQQTIQEVQQRLRNRQLGGLLPLVRRAVELRGDRDDLRRLIGQLEQREPRPGPLPTSLEPTLSNEKPVERDLLALSRVAEYLRPRLRSSASTVRRLVAQRNLWQGHRLVSTLAMGACAVVFVLLLNEFRTRFFSSLPSIFTNSIGMTFKAVPAGSFTMGDAKGDAGETPHKVTLSKPFHLGLYEVTQEEFERIMTFNPSRHRGPKNPVDSVLWEEALIFCRKLSDLPKEKAAGRVYRLPTEAEWEYACRAGTTTHFSFGEELSRLVDYGWDGSGGRYTHPVGQKKPNPWGFFDLHGNVWEWCSDWHAEYPKEPVSDPTGVSKAEARVARGGSWFDDAWGCRSARRGALSPSLRRDYHGFRVVLVQGESK